MIPFVTEYIKAGKNDTLEEYLGHGGFTALRKAFAGEPQQVIDEIRESGISGRGGAYFPAAIKWQTVKDTDIPEGGEKYIVCNCDEGEPGTFKDRYLLENCCWQIFEGMLLAAYGTGAAKGYLYLRAEYRYMDLSAAIGSLKENHYLGENILGTEFSFDIELRSGGGAYVCGEESALLESLEGKRGLTRTKPPIPAVSGLWNCPTLINNAETFAAAVQIICHGSRHYTELGVDCSEGTKLICLSGAFKNKGVFEVPLGISMEDIIYQLGGGPAAGKAINFIHLGGLTGSCITLDEAEKLTYGIDALRSTGLSVGTGAIYAGASDIDYREYMESAFEFFAHESCGRCTPCREGLKQISLELLNLPDSLPKLERIGEIMKRCSACGLGQAAPIFLKSILTLYKTEKGISGEQQ